MIQLMILMVGMLYLAIAIFITKLIVRTSKDKPAKWLLGSVSALMFFLIPTWDEIAGSIYFNSLCKSMAGQKVNKSVVLADEFFLLPGEVDINTAGRVRAKGGELNHERLKEKFQTDKVSEKVSQYFRIDKETRTVRSLQTSEVLATDTRFYFFGGWLVNSTGLHVSGKSCPESNGQYYREFYAAIFRRGEK